MPKASQRLVQQTAGVQSLLQQQALPDEPYFPSPPPWPPTQWTQAKWDRWWNSLARWCAFCESRRGAGLPALPPPPRVTEGEAAWRSWWSQLHQWGFPFEPVASPELPPFPPAWKRTVGQKPYRCKICLQIFEAEDARPCPECGQTVCRSCLYFSHDHCPVHCRRHDEGEER
jgi:hypothetical protein